MFFKYFKRIESNPNSIYSSQFRTLVLRNYPVHYHNPTDTSKKMEREKEIFIEQILHDGLFFGKDELALKKKTINKEIWEIFVSDSGYTSNMVNRLKNLTNL